MAPHLNLAALTGEELERLLGVDAAQKLRPELSRARMEGKVHRGPDISRELHFEELAAREWGATAEHTRQLRGMRESLITQGLEPLGAFYAPAWMGSRHQLALAGGDCAVALRWSETLHDRALGPFAQMLTLLRDRASGFVGVFTTTAARAPTPALNEEVALRHLPGADVLEALGAHRAEVLRHGRAQRVNGLEDWQRAWQVLWRLNLQAWERRAVLAAPGKGET